MIKYKPTLHQDQMNSFNGNKQNINLNRNFSATIACQNNKSVQIINLKEILSTLTLVTETYHYSL